MATQWLICAVAQVGALVPCASAQTKAERIHELMSHYHALGRPDEETLLLSSTLPNSSRIGKLAGYAGAFHEWYQQ